MIRTVVLMEAVGRTPNTSHSKILEPSWRWHSGKAVKFFSLTSKLFSRGE